MLTIIVPVFNESAGITDFLNELKLNLANLSYPIEVIIVDDYSTDHSKNLIENFILETKEELNHVFHLIQNQSNLGYGASIKKGMLHSKFKTCAIIDADVTYSVQDLLTLVENFQQESTSMIVGARSGKIYQGNLTKKIMRSVLKKIVEYMANRRIPDINSGIRVFDKAIATNNLRLLSDRFSFTTSLTLVFMLNGATVKYIPIEYRKRSGESKVRLMGDAIKTLGLILVVSFYFNPMKILYPITLLLLILSIIMFFISIALQSSIFFFISSLFLVNGMVILAIGLCAHLISLKLNN